MSESRISEIASLLDATHELPCKWALLCTSAAGTVATAFSRDSFRFADKLSTNASNFSSCPSSPSDSESCNKFSSDSPDSSSSLSL